MTTNQGAFSDADVRGSIPDELGKKEKKAKKNHEWYLKNKERHQANNVAWIKANPEKIALARKKRREQSPLENLRESIKLALKRKGGDITADFMLQMWLDQDGRCALSGIKMVWGGGKATGKSMSIDRIDQIRGYFKDNVRLVCHAINSFRGKMSDDEMFMMARELVGNMQAKLIFDNILEVV